MLSYARYADNNSGGKLVRVHLLLRAQIKTTCDIRSCWDPLHGCVQKSVSKSWQQFYVVVFSHHQAASGQHAITGRVMLLNVIHKMSPVKVFSKSDAGIPHRAS